MGIALKRLQYGRTGPCILVSRESKYPMFKDPGPKNHTLNGFWNRDPKIWSTWTLCGSDHDTGPFANLPRLQHPKGFQQSFIQEGA